MAEIFVHRYLQSANGLGPGGLGPSNRDAPKNPNPFHVRGSNRKPNHQTPQTTN